MASALTFLSVKWQFRKRNKKDVTQPLIYYNSTGSKTCTVFFCTRLYQATIFRFEAILAILS